MGTTHPPPERRHRSRPPLDRDLAISVPCLAQSPATVPTTLKFDTTKANIVSWKSQEHNHTRPKTPFDVTCFTNFAIQPLNSMRKNTIGQKIGIAMGLYGRVYLNLCRFRGLHEDKIVTKELEK